MLLPSGPDTVREAPSRETQPSSLLTEVIATSRARGQEFNPATADCGYRAPLPPRLARPNSVVGLRLADHRYRTLTHELTGQTPLLPTNH